MEISLSCWRRLLFVIVSLLGFTLLMVAPIAHAQAQGRTRTIGGMVRDESDSPLGGVEVAIDVGRSNTRRTRTDDQGRFYLGVVRTGAHELRFRLIGYYPVERPIVVGDSSLTVAVVLKRVPSILDTVRVHGYQVGVIGVVATSGSLRPVDSAEVEVLHTKARTQSANGGHFALVDGVPSGPQVVFARSAGFLPKMLSLTVPESSTVEVALGLERLSAPGAKRIAMPLADLEERTRWMGGGAALVSGVELAPFRGLTLGRALKEIPSLRNRGLIEDISCVLINGLPSGIGSAGYTIDDVEAIEIYRPGSDYTGTLAQRGCPNSAALPQVSGRPFTPAQRPKLMARGNTLVIWLKR